MLDHPVRAGFDALALVALLGAWGEHLPAITAVFGGLWYAIQIFEWAKRQFTDDDKK